VDCGVVLRADSLADREKAHAAGVGVSVSSSWNLPWEATLFCRPPAKVPWDLIRFGFDLLYRWDIAAPFDRSGMLASQVDHGPEYVDVSSSIGDLRQPLISTELIFARRGYAGAQALMLWRSEKSDMVKAEPRLGLLCALAVTKPRFCALPRAWLADASERARMIR
jgi:hypothetical protein